MLIKRFYHDGLAQASYLIGCQTTGEALVIDANRDIEQYLTAATAEGMRITLVTETHIHADYLSGSRELAERAVAKLLLSGEGGPDWQYAFAAESGATLLHDGDRFMLGRVQLDVVHTPGHTPEHLVLVVTDTPASPHPVGAFTGDFLFVGDVGRPDLLERAAQLAGTMRGAASQLFDSLQRFVSHFPVHLQLWPGHGSGSACGKSLGSVPQSTLGYERLANWALQVDDRETFIESVLEGQPDPPPYFARMKRLNRAGPAMLGRRPAPVRLAAETLPARIAAGATILDLRRADAAAERFIEGTLNIPLNKSFVGWAGWLVDGEEEVLLLSDATDEREALAAASELAMIGIDRVGGWYGADAFASWSTSGRTFDAMEQVDAAGVAASMRDDNVVVVDVRAADEWAAGHLPGAVHLPLGRLRETLDRIPADARIVMQCQGGGRSAIATSLARLAGRRDVANLRGGFDAWRASDLPVEAPTNAVSG